MGRNVCYNFGKRNLVDSIKNKSAQGLLWPGFVGKVHTQGWNCVCSGSLHRQGTPLSEFYSGSGMIRPSRDDDEVLVSEERPLAAVQKVWWVITGWKQGDEVTGCEENEGLRLGQLTQEE